MNDLASDAGVSLAAHASDARLSDPLNDFARTRSAKPNLTSLGFTPRQTDVLALLLQGQSNKLIARGLDVSVETVKDHVAALLRKLNVASRTQAVLVVTELSRRQSLVASSVELRATSSHAPRFI